MHVLLRRERFEDLEALTASGWPGCDPTALQSHWNYEWGGDGQSMFVPSVQMHRVWVAQLGDRLVGYINYFSPYRGPTELIALSIDPTLPPATYADVRRLLAAKFDIFE